MRQKHPKKMHPESKEPKDPKDCLQGMFGEGCGRLSAKDITADEFFCP
jgi:hypothetical protein